MKSLNFSKPPVLGKENKKSLKWSVSLQISYVFHTSLFMLSLFTLHIVDENDLKHLPAGGRYLEVVMFTVYRT